MNKYPIEINSSGILLIKLQRASSSSSFLSGNDINLATREEWKSNNVNIQIDVRIVVKDPW